MLISNSLSFEDLHSFLEEKYQKYNTPEFIEDDPIQIPKQFTQKQDIEIAAFLSSVIAWGQRKTIITNAKKMMEIMGNTPYDFIIHHSEKDLQSIKNFKHRTFQNIDFLEFIKCLNVLYTRYNSLENAFCKAIENDDLQTGISRFKAIFFEPSSSVRTQKHLPDPLKGSAAKRINMFLRWMVRKDNRGVDFGIWQSIHPSKLSCPLDVHSGNVARKLGLLLRKQNDAKAVAELDRHLRMFDKNDPAKYDFALFGLGVFENF